MEAFEEIIRFFYFGNLRCDDTTSVSFLLKLLHLADRLLAAQCCSKICEAIKAKVNGVHRPVMGIFAAMTRLLFLFLETVAPGR